MVGRLEVAERVAVAAIGASATNGHAKRAGPLLSFALVGHLDVFGVPADGRLCDLLVLLLEVCRLLPSKQEIQGRGLRLTLNTGATVGDLGNASWFFLAFVCRVVRQAY